MADGESSATLHASTQSPNPNPKPYALKKKIPAQGFSLVADGHPNPR